MRPTPTNAPHPRRRPAPIMSLYLCGDGSHQDTRRSLVEAVGVLLQEAKPMRRVAIWNAMDRLSEALQRIYIPAGTGIALFAETTPNGRVWWAPVPTLIRTQAALGPMPRLLCALGADDLIPLSPAPQSDQRERPRATA